MTMPDSPVVTRFKAARRVSVPLLAIETPDPSATIARLLPILNGKAPAIQWDIVRGMRPLNPAGAAVLDTIDLMGTINPVSALDIAATFPEQTAVFMLNAHRQLPEAAFVQGVWNLRNLYKADRRTLVLLGPAFALPPELVGDVIVLDEPLPTRAEMGEILDKVHGFAQDVPIATGPARAAALDALVGLHAFTGEQVASMALTKTGTDPELLWEHKRKAIEATEGLKVWRGKEKLDDLQGIDNVKAFIRELIAADAFGAIVFIDEGEKAFAGGMSEHTGDGGVSKDQVATVLTYIQDTRSLGVLLGGLAGTGKTQLAKAVAAESGKPLIMFDLGGLKGAGGGVVGQAGAAIRNALKVITATAEGRVLFMMTANKTVSFSPELNRRFPDQFFFDQPDAAGRAAIWKVYGKRFKLTAAQLAIPAGFDEGWTGAEIERVCERAAMFKKTVAAAAEFLVPSCISAKDAIADLRRMAAGRFLDARKRGVYRPPVGGDGPVAQRAIEVE